MTQTGRWSKTGTTRPSGLRFAGDEALNRAKNTSTDPRLAAAGTTRSAIERALERPIVGRRVVGGGVKRSDPAPSRRGSVMAPSLRSGRVVGVVVGVVMGVVVVGPLVGGVVALLVGAVAPWASARGARPLIEVSTNTTTAAATPWARRRNCPWNEARTGVRAGAVTEATLLVTAFPTGSAFGPRWLRMGSAGRADGRLAAWKPPALGSTRRFDMRSRIASSRSP